MAGGTGRISQDDRQAVLHPGDGVLYENTRPFQWQFDDDWNVWVFSLPSESVRLSDTERRLLTARRLDGTAGLTGIVSRFLLDLARHGEDLPAGQSERVLAHASDLVVTLLSDRLDDSTRVRGAVQRSLMLRIKDYISQRFSDPALRPAEIAAAVSISTRYCTSSSKPTTRPSRCISRACAWTGPGRTSWTRGRPAGPSPRSPTTAGSATSAASTAPSSKPTQSAPKNCATPQPAQQNPRCPSSDIPGTARHTASRNGPPARAAVQGRSELDVLLAVAQRIKRDRHPRRFGRESVDSAPGAASPVVS